MNHTPQITASISNLPRNFSRALSRRRRDCLRAAAATAYAASAATALFAQQPPPFPGSVHPLGSNLLGTQVAIHDITGDGKPDLVANSSQGFVAVYTGNGAGGFSGPTNYSANASPTGLAVGNLNGDSVPDVVVTNLNADKISVLTGIGGGVLAAPVSFATSITPVSVKLADVNGDSALDAMVACRNGNVVSVLIGNGAAGFGAAANFSVAASPVSVAAADFNNDGKTDFATCNNQSSGFLSVRLGDGTGGFGALTNFSVGNFKTPSGVSVADFNLDGKMDVVVGHAAISAPGSTVFLGTGSGTFAAGVDVSHGTSPGVFGVVTSDFQLDGKPDFAAAQHQSRQIGVQLGNGAGSFTTFLTTPAPNKPTFLTAGDMNADGKPDVATQSDIPEVGVYLGGGNGLFSAPVAFSNGVAMYSPVGVDFDHNGTLDTLTPAYQFNNIAAHPGDGTGSLGTQKLNPAGAVPRQVVTGDFNSDGKPDYASANKNSNNVTVSLGTGTSTFGAGVQYAVGLAPVAIQSADFNLDTKADLLAANMNSNDLSLLTGTGTGAFAAAVNTATTSSPQCLAVADFNGDGASDCFAGQSGVKTTTVYLGSGTGTFPSTAVSTVSANNESQSSVGMGDLNLDGVPDIALAASSTATPTIGVRILHGDASGGFVQFTTLPRISTDSGVGTVMVGDADMDGQSDVFYAVTYRVYYYSRTAVGGYTLSGSYSGAGGLFHELGFVGDLNANGRPDMVMGSSSDLGGIAVLSQLTPAPVGTAQYGNGTTGCMGRLGMGSNSVPFVGNSDFKLTTTNAPRSSLGVCIVTDALDVAGTDYFGINVLLHLNLITATEIISTDSYSDSAGSAFAFAPIPSVPSLSGAQYYAQALFVESPLFRCSFGQYGLVSSNGVHITIQP